MTKCYCGGSCPCGRDTNPTNFELIKDQFHPSFGTFDPVAPVVPPFPIVEFRANLIFEEFKELMAELGFYLVSVQPDPTIDDWEVILVPEVEHTYDLEKIAKESADLKVVTYGTDAAFGLPADKAFRAVHESNMTKLTADGQVLRRSDGKILKSDQYKEPDMSIIFDHST